MPAHRRLTQRRRKRGKGWSDFVAGFTAPIRATVDVLQGNYGAAAKRFTDLGPLLSQGFTGRGARVTRGRGLGRGLRGYGLRGGVYRVL